MPYKTNTPNYKSNIPSFREFVDSQEDMEDLGNLKRSFKPNNSETHNIPKNSKLHFNKKTRKMDDSSYDEIKDFIESKKRKKVNEGIKDYLLAGALGLSTPSMGDINTNIPPIEISDEENWYRADGKPNFFRIVMTETKRREAMGKAGAELKPYMDGNTRAIGYGNHIKYLSPKWQKIIADQKDVITEQQARQMLYETFEELDIRYRKLLPNLTEPQRWAVKSLAFNWGSGNLSKSALWSALVRGEKNPKKLEELWLRTQVGTENHRKSRRMEVALYTGDYNTAISIAKNAYKDLIKRGDFKLYK